MKGNGKMSGREQEREMITCESFAKLKNKIIRQEEEVTVLHAST